MPRERKVRPKVCLSALILFAMAVAGCASTPQSAPNAPPVTLVPDYRVIIDQTIVTFDHGSIDISGSVHRQPSLSGAISGRVDIEFIGPDGELLDELPALLIPHDLQPGKHSTYHTSYGYIPPKGSRLRIHFVDSDTEAREDMEGFVDMGDNGVAVGNTGGGAAHGGHGGGGGMNHYGGTRSRGGFGGGFGNFNFSPNGRH